jgi:hypothetical protein
MEIISNLFLIITGGIFWVIASILEGILIIVKKNLR